MSRAKKNPTSVCASSVATSHFWDVPSPTPSQRSSVASASISTLPSIISPGKKTTFSLWPRCTASRTRWNHKSYQLQPNAAVFFWANFSLAPLLFCGPRAAVIIFKNKLGIHGVGLLLQLSSLQITAFCIFLLNIDHVSKFFVLFICSLSIYPVAIAFSAITFWIFLVLPKARLWIAQENACNAVAKMGHVHQRIPSSLEFARERRPALLCTRSDASLEGDFIRIGGHGWHMLRQEVQDIQRRLRARVYCYQLIWICQPWWM